MSELEIKPHDCGLDGLTFTEPSLCKFEFASDCDIHNIIDRFLRTGQLPQERVGQSLDVTGMPKSYQDMQDRIAVARQDFEQLPLDEQVKYGNVEAWLERQLERLSPSNPATVVKSDSSSLSDKSVDLPAAPAGAAGSRKEVTDE